MDTPVRILQVVGNVGAGGLETLIMNWYRKIDRTKVQFDFLVNHEKKAFYEDEILSLGGKVYHTSILDDKNLIKYLFFLNDFFKQHKEYKVVHGHHSALGAIYLKAAQNAGVPVRISHSHIASFSKTSRGLVKYIITRGYGKYANIHFACSNAAGIYMYGTKTNFTVIHNGIDIEKFKYRKEVREDFRRKKNLDGKLVVVHVGRFHDQKNHVFLLEIFAEIQKLNPDSILLMAGEGPLLESIKDKARNLKIEKSCFFLGNRNDINQLLCASDVFVFPSLYEGLPLTLIEAQTSGLPIVCSDTITNETKLCENYTALSLKKDAKFWAREVIYIVQNQTNRDKYYVIVKKKNYDNYDVAMQMQQFYLENSRI